MADGRYICSDHDDILKAIEVSKHDIMTNEQISGSSDKSVCSENESTLTSDSVNKENNANLNVVHCSDSRGANKLSKSLLNRNVPHKNKKANKLGNSAKKVNKDKREKSLQKKSLGFKKKAKVLPIKDV